MIEKKNSNVTAGVFACIQPRRVRVVVLKTRHSWLRELFGHLKPAAELGVDLFVHRLETSGGCVDHVSTMSTMSPGVHNVSISFLKFGWSNKVQYIPEGHDHVRGSQPARLAQGLGN